MGSGLSVAMVVKELRFGWASHTKPLVAALQKIGVDVTLFVGRGNDIITNSIASRLMLSRKFDVLHIQGSPYGGFLKNKRIPVVTTVHTTLWGEWQYNKSVFYKLGKPFERNTFGKSDRIIIVNEVLRKELLHIYGVQDSKIVHVHNAVDGREFDAAGAVFRGSFVFSCGRDIKRKGFDVLRKACKEADISLRLVHGKLSRKDLVLTYKSAAMFVCPSFYETGPITVMEAMASRCPVICSDIPAVNNLVVDGETGLLFDVGDAGALKDKMLFLFRNKGFAGVLADRAYSHVRKNYGWDDSARRTKEVYEELLT